MLFTRFLELAGCIQQRTLLQQSGHNGHCHDFSLTLLTRAVLWGGPQACPVAMVLSSEPDPWLPWLPSAQPQTTGSGGLNCSLQALLNCGLPHYPCPCPHPVTPPTQPQQDVWMQQFVSCLYGKRLVIKAFQSAGNIYWLELRASKEELAVLNLLLCSAQAVALNFCSQ